MDKLIESPTVDMPAPDVLSAETRADLHRMEDALAGAGRAQGAGVRAWIEAGPSVWVRLRGRGLALPTHRLIAHARFDFDPDAGRPRSILEAEHVDAARGTVAQAAWLTDEAFVAAMCSLHGGLGTDGGGREPGRGAVFGELRDKPAYSAADAEGYAIRYPDPQNAQRSLASMRSAIAQTWTRTPAFASLAFMVALGAAHPFADGNGRLARLMSNAILQEGTGTSIYLPFHELSYVTGGSLILCLREAAYFGRWEPMARWFCDLAALAPVLADAL